MILRAMTVVLVTACAAIISLVPKAQADSVDNAYRLCAAFDGTGQLSQKCSVSGWSSAVDISLDTTAAQARKMCTMVADFTQKNGLVFDAGWQLRIYSPFSRDRTIAVCPIR